MSDDDLTGLHLDVYESRDAHWNPEYGDLEIPAGWELLLTGEAFVTRTVKAAGTYWMAWLPRSKGRAHRRLLGLWAPESVIAEARELAAKTETVSGTGSPSVTTSSLPRRPEVPTVTTVRTSTG